MKLNRSKTIVIAVTAVASAVCGCQSKAPQSSTAAPNQNAQSAAANLPHALGSPPVEPQKAQ